MKNRTFNSLQNSSIFKILTIFFVTIHYNWFWSKKFAYINEILEKNGLPDFYEAVAPKFGRANSQNFGGCWRSDFWIFSKIISIDPLSRSWNNSFYSWSLFCFLLITEGVQSRLQRNSSFAFRNHLFGTPSIFEINYSSIKLLISIKSNIIDSVDSYH